MNTDVGAYHYTLFTTKNPDDAPRAIVLARAGSDVQQAVDEANAALQYQGSGWTFTVESVGTHGFVIPIELTHMSTTPQQAVRTPSQALGRIADLQTLFDPLLLGAPAYKPGALTRGDFGRVPVSVQLAPPPRPPVAGRRPVVAILDTDVDPHPWWDGDDFCVNARDLGWDPGPRLPSPDPLAGRLARELADQEGHGTFTTGLVRQIAPGARVIVVPVISPDGDTDGGRPLNAMTWLADTQLQKGDVVCLPFGFQPVLPGDRRYLNWLAEVLGRLANGGVTVVAAAGNDGSDDPTYPAAFAASAGTPNEYRIRSVGALNVADDETPAYYSNTGRWVTHREVGTSVISTFPKVNAAAAAEFELDGRRSTDPDDFRGGFARWSGTSFAAAIHAAKIARDGY